MGLNERKAAKEFETKRFPQFQQEIHTAVGFAVPIEVSWDTLSLEGASSSYDETWTKIYFQPLIKALVEGEPLRGRPVPRRRQHDLHREQVVGAEAELHLLQLHEAADEQPRPGERGDDGRDRVGHQRGHDGQCGHGEQRRRQQWRHRE